MNKSSSIFIFFSLFVALSESFPKMYLVETEAGSKKNNTKDVKPSGCLDYDGSGKIFKDGEIISPSIKCVCNSKKPSAIKEKKCNWQTRDWCDPAKSSDYSIDYCYEACMEECLDLYLFNLNPDNTVWNNSADNTKLDEFQCFKLCSRPRGNKEEGERDMENYGCVDNSDSGHIYKHGEELVFDYEEVDTFKCVCNTEKPSAAAIMERKCNWHFSTGSYMEDDNEGYKLCTGKCEGFLKFNKSKCSKICSIWKN